MKKIVSLAALIACASLSTFALDSVFTPAGRVTSYTKTEYSVTSKFGDYFRSVSSKKVHVYDITGLETSVSAYDAKDQLINTVTYTYDVSRNILSATCTDVNGAVITKTVYTYTNAQLASESDYNAADALIGKTIYKYDGAKITESYYDGNGALLSRLISTTDANGKITDENEYYGDGSFASKKHYTYTDAGKLSQVESKDLAGNVLSKQVYKYDANAFLTEIQSYNNAGVLIQRDIYKNDAKGNPTRISIYEIAEKFGATSNELIDITEYVYKYASAGK